MKTIFKIVILVCCIQSNAQVGINTTTPGAQFEIKASNCLMVILFALGIVGK